MITKTDGKTQKDNRGNKYRLSSDCSQGLDDAENSSRINGVKQDRAHNDDCSREDISNKINGSNTPAGKILDRLKQLEAEHLSQISEYQELFKSRFEESKQRELAFRQSVRELEQDIQKLMSISDN